MAEPRQAGRLDALRGGDGRNLVILYYPRANSSLPRRLLGTVAGPTVSSTGRIRWTVWDVAGTQNVIHADLIDYVYEPPDWLFARARSLVREAARPARTKQAKRFYADMRAKYLKALKMQADREGVTVTKAYADIDDYEFALARAQEGAPVRVQATYGGEGRRYTFDAPEGTRIGDELSDREDGGGRLLVVEEIGSDYEGEVRSLHPAAERQPTPEERQAAVIATLRETGLMGDATDAEIWQAAVRVGERHGPGTAMRDPAAVARELGRVEPSPGEGEV